jgi:hypothetical protein
MGEFTKLERFTMGNHVLFQNTIDVWRVDGGSVSLSGSFVMEQSRLEGRSIFYMLVTRNCWLKPSSLGNLFLSASRETGSFLD